VMLVRIKDRILAAARVKNPVAMLNSFDRIDTPATG
jgi:hypothetical protein